jgi:chemotaxis-related protein WspD
MSTTADVPEIRDDCWNRIGVAGDGSCPELVPHVHCRNCPVFAGAARRFLDRPAPEGYLAEWAAFLAAPEATPDTEDVSLLVFRLGEEWLALATKAIVEVATPLPAHRIPHRSNEILVGMVNLRGQLHLLVSLRSLIGAERTGHDRETTAEDGPDNPRLIVAALGGKTWLFEAEQVVGVRRFPQSRLGGVPSTLANPEKSFSRAVIDWEGRTIGVLDVERLSAALGGLGA